MENLIGTSWHYGDGAGGPHPTKNDWAGDFGGDPAKQAEFEAITTTVAPGQFAGLLLEAVSLPQVITIGQQAFFEPASTGPMQIINIPKAETIGDYAFNGSGSVIEIYAPAADTIGDEAFSRLGRAPGDKTIVRIPNKFNSDEEKMRIFAESPYPLYTFIWITPPKVTKNQIVYGTHIQDKQYIWNGKKVVKIVYGAKECILRPISDINSFTGTFTTDEQEDKFLLTTTEVLIKAFENEDHLSDITMKEVITIGSEAFKKSPLKSLDLPKVETIGDHAFESGQITTLDLPKVITIGAAAFDQALLTTLDLPKVKTIGGSAFQRSQLTSLNLPVCTSILNYAFYQSQLTTLSLPECATIARDAFGHSPLTTLSIPNAVTIGDRAFQETINAASTTVTMKLKFNSTTEKDRIFNDSGEPSGTGWNLITFNWVP